MRQVEDQQYLVPILAPTARHSTPPPIARHSIHVATALRSAPSEA
jgi:hypothetical protein